MKHSALVAVLLALALTACSEKPATTNASKDPIASAASNVKEAETALDALAASSVVPAAPAAKAAAALEGSEATIDARTPAKPAAK